MKSTRNEGKPLHPKMELAIPVSNQVQIQDVRLIQCKSSIAPEAVAPPLPPRLRPTLKREATTQVNQEHSQIAVFVHFLFSAVRDERPNDKPCVSIDSTFLVSYTAEDLTGLGAENFDSFGALNGVFNAWPYWRELLHNTISRMGLPAFVLPVLRVGSPARASVDEKGAPGDMSQGSHGQHPGP